MPAAGARAAAARAAAAGAAAPHIGKSIFLHSFKFQGKLRNLHARLSAARFGYFQLEILIAGSRLIQSEFIRLLVHILQRPIPNYNLNHVPVRVVFAAGLMVAPVERPGGGIPACPVIVVIAGSNDVPRRADGLRGFPHGVYRLAANVQTPLGGQILIKQVCKLLPAVHSL